MPPTIRRLFGMVADANAGGTPYDTLVSGAVPDATEFWPVTGGTSDKNLENIDRNAEVRGRRAASRPVPFRAAPELTVPLAAYGNLVAKALRKAMGGTDSVTGTPPASVTHTWPALGFGSTALPAVHAQLVRDDENLKVAGCSFNRVSLDFPLDGEGTAEINLWGLYHKHDVAAAPSTSFTGLSPNPMMLRDAQVFIDGSGTSIPDLQGFRFSWDNQLRREWFAKKNVVTQSLGTPVTTYKRWFPTENRLGSAQEVRWGFNLSTVNTTQQLAHDYAQAQKFVFEVVADPLGTTPPANELLRITIYNSVLMDGGPEALSARDDINSSYEAGAFYDETAAKDVLVEYVNASVTLIV